MSRDWSAARAKVDAEGACRRCGRVPYGPWVLDAAHTISRAQGGTDDALGIIPLCRLTNNGGVGCHHLFDMGQADILPLLTKEEQAYAVSLVGLVGAWRRLTGEREPMGVRNV